MRVPGDARLYAKALKRVDAGWMNAFGWSNIGIERYFEEYFEPDRAARTGSSVARAASRADEFGQLVETVNERRKPGDIAAIEFNVSCHNVNFPFETILEDVPPAAPCPEPPPGDPQGPPDYDYL